jgi:hypothetical protein
MNEDQYKVKSILGRTPITKIVEDEGIQKTVLLFLSKCVIPHIPETNMYILIACPPLSETTMVSLAVNRDLQENYEYHARVDYPATYNDPMIIGMEPCSLLTYKQNAD